MRSLRFIVTGSMLALILVSGCGYEIGVMHRPDVESIAIPVWTRGSGVYRRGLEMQLTKAIVNRIQLDTRYKLTNVAKADTKLVGELTNVRQQIVAINTDTGGARAKEVTFTVSFRWVDLRNGEDIVVRDNFDIRGRYITTDPFNETFFQGSQEVIDEAAQRIVEQLEEGWPDSEQNAGDEKL